MSGWLPVEAQDDLSRKEEAASEEAAARLLALPPRDRVLALMRLAAAEAEETADRLLPGDLRRVLESFEGGPLPDDEALARFLPDPLAPGA